MVIIISIIITILLVLKIGVILNTILLIVKPMNYDNYDVEDL